MIGRVRRASHLLTMPLEGGTAKDLTPGRFDVPDVLARRPRRLRHLARRQRSRLRREYGSRSGDQHQHRYLRRADRGRRAEAHHDRTRARTARLSTRPTASTSRFGRSLARVTSPTAGGSSLLRTRNRQHVPYLNEDAGPQCVKRSPGRPIPRASSSPSKIADAGRSDDARLSGGASRVGDHAATATSATCSSRPTARR